MKVTVLALVIIALFVKDIYAQGCSQKSEIFRVPDRDLWRITDSLKGKLLSDTIHYNRKNLVHSSIGTMNKKPYSPLVIINKRFNYKLDIVPGVLVKEFTDNILKRDNIKAMYILSEQVGLATHGEYGKKGIIFIELKRIQKVNFKIAGFKMSRDKLWGNNFEQGNLNTRLYRN